MEEVQVLEGGERIRKATLQNSRSRCPSKDKIKKVKEHKPYSSLNPGSQLHDIGTFGKPWGGIR